MSSATQVLRNEHNAILEVLETTEQVSQLLNKRVAVPPHVLSNIIEFFRLFADRCHHGKEEDLLFPLLQKKGMPAGGGPIAVMLMEHDQGRAFIREMVEAAQAYEKGDKPAGQQWADAAENYVMLLRQHIDKENNVLFIMAERLLSASDQQQLAVAFDEVETKKLGAGTHERLHRLKDSLSAEVGALAKN